MAFSNKRSLIIHQMFRKWSGSEAEEIIPLPQSGSQRSYYRVRGKNAKNAIAAFNDNPRENIAFIYLARHFRENGIHVPGIYLEDRVNNCYLLEDLGFELLFDRIIKEKSGLSGETHQLIKKSLQGLLQMQLATEKLDFSYCYPRASFDKQSIHWDLEYFKYYFAKLYELHFDEQKLEVDFSKFTHFLLQAKQDYFMYRDFQSRNIMIRDKQVYFIDFQGGRKGPLPYDLASFLFQVRAEFPWEFKMDMLSYYLHQLKKRHINPGEKFRHYFFGFAFLRLMQVLGAYGYRGVIQNKSHFLVSIPYAVTALKELFIMTELPVPLHELSAVFKQIFELEFPKNLIADNNKLSVCIHSFSYKKGLPTDYSGNGGGYVFDCRALPNPGRIEKFRSLNGLEKPVSEYLERHSEVDRFMDNCTKIVKQSIDNYIARGFTNLSVGFGCTGGQHRSVYCANSLFEELNKRKNMRVFVEHRELKD